MTKETAATVWQTLSRINVTDKIEAKNGFSYLSWAWAWGAVKDAYPSASYEKHIFDVNGMKVPYMKTSQGGYVVVTVRAGGEEATEVFPILNHANKPIQDPNPFDVNTALQRCMTKAIAMLGLGHYIYAGEDLPPDDITAPDVAPKTATKDAALPPTSDAVVFGIKREGGEKAEVEKASGVAMIKEVFLKFLPTATVLNDVNYLWRSNTVALETLKAADEAVYNEVVGAFATRKAEIQKQGAK